MTSKKRGKKGRNSINKKLDLVLKGQENLLKEDIKIEKETEKQEQKEEEVKQLEERQLTELEKLEQIEKEVEGEVKQHPLTKITIHDVFKGSLGAIIGTTLHYTVFYGVEIARNISTTRATIIYILSFLIGMVFLYVTGFRKVKDSGTLIFLPVRMIILYCVSIVISVLVLFLFFPTFGQSFEEAYKEIATVSLIAVIGACTADLMGKE